MSSPAAAEDLQISGPAAAYAFWGAVGAVVWLIWF